MSTATTNYGFNLPAVADPIDEDLWGTELNTNFSSLDDILPTPAANKYGAIAVQNNTDDGLEYITSQGTSGQVFVSNGPDALPSFQNLSALVGAIVYPVGSYYINETDSTNPGTLLGFGTWTAVQDKFIVARGGTYAGTGGAATVTLVEGNLPIHHHKMFADENNNVGTSVTADTYAPRTRSPTNDTDYQIVQSSGSGTTPATVGKTSSVGSGTAFSIIPTYQAAYIWKRTA